MRTSTVGIITIIKYADEFVLLFELAFCAHHDRHNQRVNADIDRACHTANEKLLKHCPSMSIHKTAVNSLLSMKRLCEVLHVWVSFDFGNESLPMSASLIGRSGSSAFRLSIAAVSASLTGSCFSSESAPGPFHHGIRERGGTIFGSVLPSDERQLQADMRSHLIHRPARDIIPPRGGARMFSC